MYANDHPGIFNLHKILFFKSRFDFSNFVGVKFDEAFEPILSNSELKRDIRST